jgi:hypothetical protein
MNGDNCDRALTNEIKKGAREFGLDISRFLMHPQCFIRKKNK